MGVGDANRMLHREILTIILKQVLVHPLLAYENKEKLI